MTGHVRRRGRLVVIAAPSGAGKTTLVRALLEREPGLEFSVSYTTRPPRSSERDGVDYFFVPEQRFVEMVRRGGFLEHARVFDHWYGTGREHVESLLEAGRSVLLEIDWQGARQVRERAPEALTVFVLPPSLAELEKRLRGRATDTPAVIERRLADAVDDMSHWNEFGYVVVNDDVERAADELAAIVRGHGAAHRTDTPQARARVERVFQTAAGAG
ncbi:MAG: guanylate kinase [Gammaproteobacteria bacterium]|nr:guanylate kinase [Gammaproteobacteria bacterium]